MNQKTEAPRQISKEVCLNPFSKIKNIHDDIDRLKMIVAKMASPSQVLDDFSICSIERKITDAFNRLGKNATITTVSDMCLHDSDSRIQDIGLMLYPYTSKGQYGKLFDGACNIDSIDDPDIQCLFEKKELRDIIPFLFFPRKSVNSVDELVDKIGPDLIITGLQALRRERISAFLAASVVSSQRGDPTPNENDFGIAEVDVLLRSLL